LLAALCRLHWHPLPYTHIDPALQRIGTGDAPWHTWDIDQRDLPALDGFRRRDELLKLHPYEFTVAIMGAIELLCSTPVKDPMHS
jgi:hypothetical protein